MTAQPNLLELAKQGDARAIAALMNRSLQPKGITAKAAVEGSCLLVRLEADSLPNQSSLVGFIQKGLLNLGVSSLYTAKILGIQAGEPLPAWEETIELQPIPVAETGTSGDAIAADLHESAPSPLYPVAVDEIATADPEAIEEATAPPQQTSSTTSLLKDRKAILLTLAAAAIGFGAVVLIVPRFQQAPTPLPAPVETPVASPPASPEASAPPAETPTASPVPTTSPDVSPTTSPAASPTTSPDVSPTTSPAASPTTSPVSSPGASPRATPATSGAAPTAFSRALEQGLDAAVDTQTARTRSQWNAVANGWEEAIALLRQVRTSDPNYVAAQQKITEYQRNLAYAQRKAREAEPPRRRRRPRQRRAN